MTPIVPWDLLLTGAHVPMAAFPGLPGGERGFCLHAFWIPSLTSQRLKWSSAVINYHNLDLDEVLWC